LLPVKQRHSQSGNGEGTRRSLTLADKEGKKNGQMDNEAGEEDEEEGDDLDYLPDNRAAFLHPEVKAIFVNRSNQALMRLREAEELYELSKQEQSKLSLQEESHD
jgi:hypothetical protein